MAGFYKYSDNPTVYGDGNKAFSTPDEFFAAGGAKDWSNVQTIQGSAPSLLANAPGELASIKQQLNNFQNQTFEQQQVQQQQETPKRQASILDTKIAEQDQGINDSLAHYAELTKQYESFQAPDLFGQYQQLRTQQGVPGMEQSFLDTRAQRRELPYQQRAAMGNAGVATEGQLGATVEQKDVPLGIEEANLNDRLALANNFVNTAVSLKDKDSATSRDALAKAIDLVGNTINLHSQQRNNLSTQQRTEKQDATDTLNSILTLTKGRTFDELDSQTQRVITDAVANTSLTLGAVKQAMEAGPQAQAQAQQEEAKKFAIDKGITTPFYTVAGTVYRTSDNKAYATPEEFFADGGAKDFSNAPQLPAAAGDLDTQVVTAGGRSLLINSVTGETIKDLGGAYKDGDGPGVTKTIKFTPDENKRLLAAGFNNADIDKIEADVNEYGIDSVVEGMSDSQAKAVRNVLGGVTPTQETAQAEEEKDKRQFLTTDYFKKLYPAKTLESEAKKAGFMTKRSWAPDVPDTQGYLNYLQQTVQSYREAGYTDQEILKMMQ